MNDHHRDLHALLASLGHASRFRIALRLLEHDHSVGELALAIGLSQSCTTRHVQALERAGVVASRRDGKRVLVGIRRDRAGLAELIDWLGPDAGLTVVPLEARTPSLDPLVGAGPLAAERARGARSKGRSQASSRSAPPLPPEAAEDPAQEEPPAGPPGSGTHPVPAPTVVHEGARPRARDTIEDFLL
jgi:DNA-binding transcriptional ArsR family regulator